MRAYERTRDGEILIQPKAKIDDELERQLEGIKTSGGRIPGGPAGRVALRRRGIGRLIIADRKFRCMDRSPTRRVLLAGGAAAVGAAVAGCSGDSGSGSGDDNTVMAGTGDQPVAFVSDEITVSVGTTVTWEWGTDNHNIHVQNQPEAADWPGEQEVFNEGHEYSYTFEVPGTYEYICQPHASQGMAGAVVVEE